MPGAFDPPMQVEFDRQIFVTQFKGGVGRYFGELIDTFRDNPDIGVNPQIHAPFVVNEMRLSSSLGKRVPHPFPSRLTRRLAPHLAEALCQAMPNRVRDPQIRHYTQYSLKYWKQDSDVKNVCTIYDMIPEKFPEYFPDGNPHQDKEFFARNCDLIICISETTRTDLLDAYGPLRAPVHVVPLAVGPPFTSILGFLERPRWLPREDFALFVGNRARYKDFPTVLEGLAASTLGPKHLVCIGGGRPTKHDMQAIGRSASELEVKFLNVDDEHLAHAYHWATFYVSASRYEGFGLPTLEAIAQGCPVILSDCPAHLEVAGDRGLFFRCGDNTSLAEAIDHLIDQQAVGDPFDVAHRTQMTQRSLKQVAADTARAYTSLLSGKCLP